MVAAMMYGRTSLCSVPILLMSLLQYYNISEVLFQVVFNVGMGVADCNPSHRSEGSVKISHSIDVCWYYDDANPVSEPVEFVG